MYKKTLKFFPALIQRLSARIISGSYPIYQPLFRSGRITAAGSRDCLDRWSLIKEEIIKSGVNSAVDIGCAEGFYVLQAARECGCLALGIDADARRLSVAQNQLISEKIMPAGFMAAVIDNELLNKMPCFDLVIFMSVLHHMMYEKGEEYCRNFLADLRKKINKVMIFEMGQSNELKNSWAKKLPDMGDRPHEWIEEFLLSAGFSSAEKIGESDSYANDQNRAIFKVLP